MEGQDQLRIEPARAEQARELSDLALRSKGHWGYDAEFLAAVREELIYSPEDCRSGEMFVAHLGDDLVGFGRLSCDGLDGELGSLFVDPPWIGNGIGSALLAHALTAARGRGMSRVFVTADPEAAPFYARYGAQRVGDVPSGSIQGRSLPRMEFLLRHPYTTPVSSSDSVHSRDAS